MGIENTKRLSLLLAREIISLKGVNVSVFCGELDKNLKLLSKTYNSSIIIRGDNIILQGKGKKIYTLKSKILEIIEEIKKGNVITVDKILIPSNDNKNIIITPNIIIKPRTDGQIEYIDALNKFEIVVCIGPAGTGKTFLAVAKAVNLLKNHTVRRIILTRPAVEAGEKLGFLPGDFREKVDPYLRPLYDALYEILPSDKIKDYIENRMIEILPLAYMRGRNIDNSFIIVDEAQNTTKMQMKMVLTRMGVNSKICITGDITQIDLPKVEDSGLLHIKKILSKIKEIKFVELSDKDIVRHPVVKKIVKEYEKESIKKNKT